MLDDLRKDSSESAFFQEENETDPLPKAKPRKTSAGMSIKINNNFLGLTAFQRFVLSVMLLFVTCVFGMVLLFVTGKIVLPF